mgnify:CR=1 FL=1
MHSISPTHFYVPPSLHTACSQVSWFVSFRWSWHRYDHAAHTLSVLSVLGLQGGVGRCRACCKPITLSVRSKKRSCMDHVLKHVSLTVCGLCYLTVCAEQVICHCSNFHGQKALRVPSLFLGRFVVHPDLLKSLIAFSRGCRITDEQEVSVRTAFADKKILLPPQPQVMMG